MQSFEKEEKSNGNVQFVLKESTRYARGQYAIQLSYYKGKSCRSFNVLDNNNGKQVSLPDDVFETMNNQYFTINKAVDEIKKSNQGPPSPELITHYHTTDHKITSQEAEDKFSTLPWPTTQSPQSSSTQASTVGVKSTSHPTTVTTKKSAKTTDEHEEGISSTVTILISWLERDNMCTKKGDTSLPKYKDIQIDGENWDEELEPLPGEKYYGFIADRKKQN
uniref:Uncharacterized protein n=1 Tax=Magallana gigas TaxID=29159 RepID=K1PT92_MAGGI